MGPMKANSLYISKSSFLETQELLHCSLEYTDQENEEFFQKW